ncbi:MAG: hypothetical protein ABI599_10035 [Flavobacteriales bacterium]
MKKAVTIIATVLIVGAVAFALNWFMKPGTVKTAPAPVPTAGLSDKPPSDLVMGDPLGSTGLRFDGVYHAELSHIHYYMRFFPAGHVAMVGGPEGKGDGSLREMLRASVLSQRSIGLYNVPVQWRSDSLYMTAHGTKGDILYSGVIASPEKLVILKESKANGRKMVVDYAFEVDGTKPLQEEQK